MYFSLCHTFYWSCTQNSWRRIENIKITHGVTWTIQVNNMIKINPGNPRLHSVTSLINWAYFMGSRWSHCLLLVCFVASTASRWNVSQQTDAANYHVAWKRDHQLTRDLDDTAKPLFNFENVLPRHPNISHFACTKCAKWFTEHGAFHSMEGHMLREQGRKHMLLYFSAKGFYTQGVDCWLGTCRVMTEQQTIEDRNRHVFAEAGPHPSIFPVTTGSASAACMALPSSKPSVAHVSRQKKSMVCWKFRSVNICVRHRIKKRVCDQMWVFFYPYTFSFLLTVPQISCDEQSKLRPISGSCKAWVNRFVPLLCKSLESQSGFKSSRLLPCHFDSWRLFSSSSRLCERPEQTGLARDFWAGDKLGSNSYMCLSEHADVV